VTKDDLIKLVSERKAEAEPFYVAHGPRKREQEEYVSTGVAVVEMNVGLLTDWLDGEALEAFEELSKAERREVWEASGFHFGIYGYEDHDVDFWWEHEAYD